MKHDEVWSVRPLPTGTTGMPRDVLFATDRELDPAAEFHVGRHWAAQASCGVASENNWAQVTSSVPLFRACTGAAADAAPMGLFADDVAAEADSRKCHSLLLYVHGYNTMFRTALLHSGQMANDTHWPCAMGFFSWASEGQYDRYVADVERSGYAVPVLINLLRAVADKGVEENILAHSMGTRITLSAIGALESYCVAHKRKIVKELVLLAPDIGVERYNDDALHLLRRAQACVGRTTIYASDNDVVLIVSEGTHGGIPRAGRVPDKDLQYPACEALNADIVDAHLAPGDKMGHGYFINSYEMMDDMTAVLRGVALAARAGGARPTLKDGGTVQVACVDAAGETGARTADRYSLIVAPDRQPSFTSRIMRALVPLLVPLQ
ncbi:MAG: alpha/beta hydrolase [Alphaproteobacteria bacterium]|nr:alpha/beta hydrolase [Alphaproteobacteria bacterium]